MVITNRSVLELGNKGISMVDDIYQFDKDMIGKISNNLCRPPSGALFIFGAKSNKRIIVACEIVQYYKTGRCTLTAENLQ